MPSQMEGSHGNLSSPKSAAKASTGDRLATKASRTDASKRRIQGSLRRHKVTRSAGLLRPRPVRVKQTPHPKPGEARLPRAPRARLATLVATNRGICRARLDEGGCARAGNARRGPGQGAAMSVHRAV